MCWSLFYSTLSYAQKAEKSGSVSNELLNLCRSIHEYTSAWYNFLIADKQITACDHSRKEFSNEKYIKGAEAGEACITCNLCGALKSRECDHYFRLNNIENISEATKTESEKDRIVCNGCGLVRSECFDSGLYDIPLSDNFELDSYDLDKIKELFPDVKTSTVVNFKHDNCTGYGVNRSLVQRVGENQEGIWKYTCNGCGQTKSVTIYPGYQIYSINLGNGETAEVYGYYLRNSYPWMVFNNTRNYRNALGLNLDTDKEFVYAKFLQEYTDLRAVEAAYKFDHERPNGQRRYELNRTLMNGENLALGYSSAPTVMAACRASAVHHENIVYPTFNSLAVSTFVKYSLTTSEGFPGRVYICVEEYSNTGKKDFVEWVKNYPYYE